MGKKDVNPLLEQQRKAREERETIMQKVAGRTEEKEDKRRTTIYLSQEAYRKGKMKAIDEGTTFTAYVESLILEDE